MVSVSPSRSAALAIARLKRRAEFLAVAGSGIKAALPGVVLQARPRGEADGATVRVGFTATRKLGGAVVRNRARRRLKAAAHEALPLAARPGWDYVLIARAGTCTRPYGQLVADVRKALSLTARGERADRERAQA
jgi:ribonuclease P protein component